VATCEGGGLQFAAQGQERAIPRISLVTRHHPVWTEFFQTGAHCVVAEILPTTLRVRIAEIPDSPWYHWSSDSVNNPTSEVLIAALHAEGIVQTLAVPTLVGGKVTGLINIRFREQRMFRPEELELARALTHQAMLAIRLRRLSLQSRQTAIVAERNRMARDIHDTLAQGFTGVIMQLEAVRAAIKGNGLSDAAEHVQRAADLARWGLGEARRSVMALRPHSLQNGTFYMAMEEMLRRMADSSQLQVEFNVEGEPRALSPRYEDTLLRITQEALTNTVKHAGARHFNVTLSFGLGFVQLRVTDDGNGFDPQADYEGFGLVGMRERAGELGGQLVLRSMPDHGTEVQVTLKNGTAEGPGNGDEHA
jgi:signal transduction histidine kinase